MTPVSGCSVATLGQDARLSKGEAMGKDDNAPDKVTHDSEFVVGHQPWVEKTTIEKGSETYTGYGWTREEADRNAGEKYNEGKKD